MSSAASRRARSWRDTAGSRVVGAAVSWMLMAFALALLFPSVSALLSIGGSCATGGPYEIRVECPEAVALFTPLSIILGFLAVGVWTWLARGFGMPITLAWTVLFCGLGILFFGGFSAEPAAWVWLLVGAMFIVMGLGPLVIALWANPRELVLGTVSARGAPFAVASARRSWLPRRLLSPALAVAPRGADYVLSVGVTIGSAAIGALSAAWLFDLVAAGATPR